ncbi:MAG: hypothetical protein HC875_25230, partial [Anaerolineales bacterium]|nr:hypothetical protein [Anaerolineales bacterium]
MNAHLPTLIWLTLTGAMLLTAGCAGDRPTATPASCGSRHRRTNSD